MSENWPGNWYQDEEPGRPEAGPQGSSSARAQPGFTPSQGGSAPDGKRETAWGSATYGYGGAGADPSGAGSSGSAWPMQPSPRSGRSGSGGPTGPSGPTRPRGWRRWLRPKRILTMIAGSDSRGGLTAAQENQLALGRDITGSRSDTIMLLHLPANGTRPTLVSIPRDSYVPIPGVGDNKINAAYALGGPKLLIETVQNVTGLHINHFMSIGFGGLVSVVNDVGGVRMCLKAPMKDPKAGLNLKAGCQNLNGSQALGFVRTRAFAEGDLQREQDQRVLLKGILSKLTSAGTLINPFAVIPAANGAAAAISVDSSTGLSQLVSVAFALRSPVTTTVPVGGVANTTVGSVVEWNTTEARQFFSDLGHDVALPKSLITVTSVQGTA